MALSKKERLLKVLAGESADRPPVVCPGGMMTMACREVMHHTGCRWPQAHRDPEKMATLSIAMHDEGGLENVGIPFCMTVEAEAWGGEVEDGDECTEPCTLRYPLKQVSDWRTLRPLDAEKDGRLPLIVACTALLKKRLPHTPSLGNLVGPISMGTSLVDASLLYKALVKDPQDTEAFLHFLTDSAIAYGKALVAAGADVIVIADPSATGEILGPRLFTAFALPTLNKMTDAMQALGVPVIVHICGDVTPIFKPLAQLKAPCISVDSQVSLAQAKAALPDKKLMGNLSTLLLQRSTAEAIRSATRTILSTGVDIFAPACGISAKTPLANIQAMTETVKAHG